MKITITYQSDEVARLVEEDLIKRGYNIISKAKILISNRTEGDQRDSWQVPEFGGVEVDVSPKTSP